VRSDANRLAPAPSTPARRARHRRTRPCLLSFGAAFGQGSPVIRCCRSVVPFGAATARTRNRWTPSTGALAAERDAVHLTPSRGASDSRTVSSVTGVMRCRRPVACRCYGALVRAVTAPQLARSVTVASPSQLRAIGRRSSRSGHGRNPDTWTPVQLGELRLRHEKVGRDQGRCGGQTGLDDQRLGDGSASRTATRTRGDGDVQEQSDQPSRRRRDRARRSRGPLQWWERRARIRAVVLLTGQIWGVNGGYDM
jgi:hypothetical protein